MTAHTKPTRKPVNVSLDPRLVEMARELNITVSHAAEEGLRRAVEEAWKRENAAAIESSNAWVAENGLPLAKYRMF